MTHIHCLFVCDLVLMHNKKTKYFNQVITNPILKILKMMKPKQQLQLLLVLVVMVVTLCGLEVKAKQKSGMKQVDFYESSLCLRTVCVYKTIILT